MGADAVTIPGCKGCKAFKAPLKVAFRAIDLAFLEEPSQCLPLNSLDVLGLFAF